MSSLERQHEILLTARAESDLGSIFRFTAQTWGAVQTRVYRQRLERAFDLLGRHPDAGRPAPELSPSHRVYPVGAHLIIYRRLGDRIAILRVLHQRMEPPPTDDSVS